MASTTISGYPQPLYPRSASTGQSSTSLSAYDAFRSIASTPTATPPPFNPSMSFTMSQGSQGSNMMMQPGSFSQYVNASSSQQNGSAPQIYSAVYSGVDVYEMEVNGIAVMRRRNDSWLNATQILKVAGIEKGKRTKVLEKEILIGEHEKVQGGYGKYQGTWIKFDRGLEFCRQYGVEELLRPLLTYDMGQDGGIAGRGGMDTPTKEQAMAAQRKRLYNAGNDARLSGQSGTFFKNISSTASHAVAAISKARFDSPAPRKNSSRPASFSRQSSQQHLEESVFPGNSQQSMQSYASDTSYGMNGHDSAYGPNFSHHMNNSDFQEPPRKRMRPSSNVSLSQQTDVFYDQAMREPSPTEPNDSFIYNQFSQSMADQQDAPVPLPPLEMTISKAAESKRALLMSLFMEPVCNDFTSHDAFLTLSGEDLDMPIDNSAHTALHWAATLARLPLLKTLIANGASIFRVNNGGETALMRACAVTNNHDTSGFPDLLEYLGPTIEMRDSRGRTVLHHIAVTSAVKGRSQASKYYLESLLEFVVRQGSMPNSQNTAFYGTAPSPFKSMGIGRFMSEIVNAQDKSGDTALNIAARIGNRSIISQLLEVGSDAAIPNRAGLRPVDFGIGDPAQAGDRIGSPDKELGKSTRESSGEIISSITSLLSETEKEFATEIQAKQTIIDSLHSQLREDSSRLGEERQRRSELQARAKERAERAQKIASLRKAEAEERSRLEQMRHQAGTAMNGEVDMVPGDADKAFAILPTSVSSSSLMLDSRLANSLPSSSVLRGRLNAYASNNDALEARVRALKSKSKDLEGQYRKVISMCTLVPEDNVDGMLDSLIKAVSSENGSVGLPRVREFLQKVEAAE